MTNAQQATKFSLGQSVRALYPNSRWGEGVVVEHVAANDLKPLIVRRSDGVIGYFHVDQVESIR